MLWLPQHVTEVAEIFRHHLKPKPALSMLACSLSHNNTAGAVNRMLDQISKSRLSHLEPLRQSCGPNETRCPVRPETFCDTAGLHYLQHEHRNFCLRESDEPRGRVRVDRGLLDSNEITRIHLLSPMPITRSVESWS